MAVNLPPTRSRYGLNAKFTLGLCCSFAVLCLVTACVSLGVGEFPRCISFAFTVYRKIKIQFKLFGVFGLVAFDLSNMDVVHNLIYVRKFSNYSFEEKIKLKEEGRPLPDIFIEKHGSSRGKSYKRHFNRDIYSRKNWICGCNRKNALFCFPCLLFGGEKAWTQVGVTDLIHLSEKIKKHEVSKTHLQNEMEFAVLGTINIREKLDSAYWISVKKHNEDVTKNRYVLSKIIDCIKFCGIFELALRGHDETDSSENPGIFRGLINFTAELDKTVAEHLNNSKVFKGISKEIQNDLLDCMLEVCRKIILEEIRESPYLAIMADETTDVSSKSQLVVILRYSRNGEPVERFWTYIVPDKLDAENLTRAICNVLDPILENCPNKLIAQSYDGAAVMSGQRNGVQARIKAKYPYAHFIHCYAHQLNLIMSKAASENYQVRVFFGNLQEIPAFFKNSPQRVAILNEVVRRKIPHGAPTRWNFNIRMVNVVFEHRDSLIECMEEIEESFNNQTVCSTASTVRRILQDAKFVFWLTFFHHIMPHVDVLFNQLQKRKTDPLEISQNITIFEQNIISIRNSIDKITNEASDLCNDPQPDKRKRKNDSKFDHRIAALEVCDIIINCAKDRFEFKGHQLAASLFFSEQFAEYCGNFPDDKLQLACSAYPDLDKERVKTELSVIYSRPDCRAIKGAIPFLKFLIENNLSNPFQETKKLLEILITIPMSTAEAERSFSTLKRIKTFLRNSMIEDRLVALSMLSMEKKLISEAPNFNERVIEIFATKKTRRVELIYKK